MSEEIPGTVRRIAGSREVTEGRSASFNFRDQYGMPADGFVFRLRGELFAYRNQCPHQPLSLDYGDNEFFDETGDYLLCRNHGAMFDPATGKCVAGPCAGAFLRRIEVFEEGESICYREPDEGTGLELE
ncbi:MAG: Rieske 2Fe-2S domain-containing protein [Candidatus Sumerlaeaceae bacterium]|nr:Rieske 2Fe-2S domain-containing protein [Candidatus Sumerlaeaceae bacterium]